METFIESKKIVEEKEQAIVFIPTRANFKYLICQSCGYTYKCTFCSVSMSIHYKSRALKCHYCSYATQIVSNCPNCGGEEFINERIGSSEIVEILRTTFPDKRVEKFDREIITSKT